jgi:hypothetical protein
MRTRGEQIAAIRADQQFWRDLAAEVGPDRYSVPGPMGEWSFGDMAGHLLAWRRRTIGRLEAIAQGAPEPAPPWPAELGSMDDDVDAINAWMREQDEGVAPEQLVADYDASFDRIVAILDSMPDDRFTDPHPIAWLEAPLVEADFAGHLHEEHVPDVRAWLDGEGSHE